MRLELDDAVATGGQRREINNQKGTIKLFFFDYSIPFARLIILNTTTNIR